MRLNALISASVALTLLSSGHMSLAASSHSARHNAGHKAAQTSAPAAKKRTNKKLASNHTTTSHSATVKQVHASSKKIRKQSADMLQAASAQDVRLDGVRRKATPDDFMRAAGVSGSAAPQLKPGAQLAAVGASDLHGSSESSVASVAGGNPAKSVSAVGVTLSASPKPQLETSRRRPLRQSFFRRSTTSAGASSFLGRSRDRMRSSFARTLSPIAMVWTVFRTIAI